MTELIAARPQRAVYGLPPHGHELNPVVGGRTRKDRWRTLTEAHHRRVDPLGEDPAHTDAVPPVAPRRHGLEFKPFLQLLPLVIVDPVLRRRPA
jgi:hypothetical protein